MCLRSEADQCNTNLSNGNVAFRKKLYSAAIQCYTRAQAEHPEIAPSIDISIRWARRLLAEQISSNNRLRDLNSLNDPNDETVASRKQLLLESLLFDEQFYVNEYPDIQHCESPVEHYLLFGGLEGRAASKKFDSQRYLDAHPELIEKKINPLLHYLEIGQFHNFETYYYETTLLEPVQKSTSIREVELLLNSPFYDRDYYLHKYPDVAESAMSPEEHFLLKGGKEGREASPYFDCSAYLEAYEDVRKSEMNPLIHYLMFGQQEKRVAFEANFEIAPLLLATRSKKTVVLDNLPDPIVDHKSYRCALLIHAFYVDVFEEIISIAKNLPFAKVIVTTPERNYEAIRTYLYENWPTNYRVSVINENKGRDLAPFINENVDNLFDFDLICKIHTKKSPHLDVIGEKWKKYLIQNLIGSASVFNKILGLFAYDETLGMAYPEPMEGTNNHDWADNKNIAENAFKRLGINVSEEELQDLDYPPATMFWFRPEALKPIFHTFAYDEFPAEPIHFDGTLAHALERTLNYVCRSQNYSALEYVSLKTLVSPDVKEAVIFDWLDTNAERDKFIVVSHDATNTGAPKTALSLLKELNLRDKACLTILLNGGEQEELFCRYGPVINYKGQPLRESFLKLVLENKDINVICNTVVSYKAAQFFKSINLRVVALVHEFISSGHFSEDMFSTLIENADKVVYPADFVLRDTLAKISVDTKKIRLMPQGIYDDAFPVGDRASSRRRLINDLRIPDDSFVVLACGTVESRKGTDILIKAAKHLLCLNGTSKVHFVWVGKVTEDDPFYLNCLKEISSMELLRRNFHFVGAHSKVDRFFLASDMFALPSRHDPFPGVVLEGMAAKLPIVCFDDTTGVHEAFEDGIGGFVCQHLDHIDMAEKIVLIYKNSDDTAVMGNRNRSKVCKQYSFSRYTEEILKDFRKIQSPEQAESPKFSIVVPVFDTPPNYLQKLLQSILLQRYANLEICLADASTKHLTRTLIRYYAAIDMRVKWKVIDKNLGISGNTNEAISLASGDFLCLVDHDDILPVTALNEIVACITASSPDIIYTDEDKIDEYGLKHFSPVLKPPFDIDLLETHNYVTHLLTIRKAFFDKHIGALRSEFDGAQDYDLILRCSEATQNIQHIPKILYHWRVFENSTSKGTSDSKSYAVNAGLRALEAHLKRTGRTEEVQLDNREFRYVISRLSQSGVTHA